MRNDGRSVLRPVPVDASVDLFREFANLAFRSASHRRSTSARAARRRATAPYRRSTAPWFRSARQSACRGSGSRNPCSRRAGLVGSLRRIREKAQRPQRRDHGLASEDVAAFGPDHVGSQAETDGRGAGERRRGIAIRHKPVLLVRRVPEKTESAALEIVNDRIAVAHGVIHSGAFDDDARHALLCGSRDADAERDAHAERGA